MGLKLRAVTTVLVRLFLSFYLIFWASQFNYGQTRDIIVPEPQVKLLPNVLSTLKPGQRRLLMMALHNFDKHKQRIPAGEFLPKCSTNLKKQADKILTFPLVSYQLNNHLGVYFKEMADELLPAIKPLSTW